MPLYRDSEQLYSSTQALFRLIEEQDPGAADAVLAAHLVIRLHTSEPEIEFTINGRRRPVQVTYGPSPLRPTLDIELSADTLHGITLGELSLKSALANGHLKVYGPALKAMVLADLFHHMQALYPQVLREQGLIPE